MKKILLIVVISIFAYNFTVGATLQRVILSHNGYLTQYDATIWQNAITDAVAGDTVYFTSGLFTGDLTIDKAITLIGVGISETDKIIYNNLAGVPYVSGSSTTLSSSIKVSIPGDVTLTSCLIEGFNFSGTTGITVTKPVTGLSVRRCKFYGPFKADASVTNLTLESCYIGSLYCANLTNPDVHNCYVSSLYTESVEGLYFTNCFFAQGSNVRNCYFTNCIVNPSHVYFSYNTYVNCMYASSDSNSTYTNCWYVNNGQSLTAEQIMEAGYIGTDGTIVGTFGGPAPFTFKPSQPYFEEGTVEYDAANKVLNVSMKIKRGE